MPLPLYCTAYLPASGRFLDWLPNHLLVIHILFVFAVLNPLVIPFGLLYFTIQKSTKSRRCADGRVAYILLS